MTEVSRKYLLLKLRSPQQIFFIWLSYSGFCLEYLIARYRLKPYFPVFFSSNFGK